MDRILRRIALPGAMVLSLLTGCAGIDCEYLNYEEEPRKAAPIAMPAGVPAPAGSGSFQVPEGPARAITGRCPAEPPMTLDPELLIDPEDRDEEGAPEEAAAEV